MSLSNRVVLRATHGIAPTSGSRSSICAHTRAGAEVQYAPIRALAEVQCAHTRALAEVQYAHTRALAEVPYAHKPFRSVACRGDAMRRPHNNPESR